MGNSVGVKYIGKDAVYEDNILRTGLSWEKGEVHVLPTVMAKEFLKHPTVFQETAGGWPVLSSPSGSGLEPRGIAPSGTVAADGTITLGTALPAVFSAGLWLYLPAGAVSGDAAGFYWCDMSSTTVGIVRASPGGAALTGSGSGYTGVTSEITLASYTIQGGSLKKLRIEALIAQSNSAGAKTVKGKYGSGQFLNAPATTTPQQNFALHVMKVAPGVQHASNASAAGGTSLAAWMTTDDSTDQPLYITGQIAVATDYLLCVATNLLCVG